MRLRKKEKISQMFKYQSIEIVKEGKHSIKEEKNEN